VDEALLNFYVEYALECIATGVSPLTPAEFRALIFAMLADQGRTMPRRQFGVGAATSS
jgi:hypothetical protein